jgi:urease accessory protein UreF
VEGLGSFGETVGSPVAMQVCDVASLRQFVQDYVGSALAPVELPSIHKAFEHARLYQIRELIELDRQLVLSALPEAFIEASRQVGRIQLRRLRPLRDERRVQRYIRAVESGHAHGWHTVVYGLATALFSLPLRPALLSYARQTIHGFIGSAAARLALDPVECDLLCHDTVEGLKPAVEKLLVKAAGPRMLAE